MNLLPAADFREARDMTTTQPTTQTPKHATTAPTPQSGRQAAIAALRPLILDLGIPLG